ncbi:MAG: DUF938 domain-containing protein, partial [Pseudomonadales bacterium]
MFYSEACERNKNPILEVIKPWFHEVSTVLEIGSGTGQHAQYFTQHLPHLRWQMSDLGDYLANLQQQNFENLLPPIKLDVRQRGTWPQGKYDAVFTANSLHIMSASSVEKLVAGVGRLLSSGGLLVVYGPFKYGGQYTSTSNARFDQMLQQGDPESGIRDFEWVNQLAANQ